MDSSDDPDITSYHLKIRARSTENVSAAESDEKNSNQKYPWLNFLIRVIVACVFIGLCFGLLIWSLTRQEIPIETSSTTEISTIQPPEFLNMARSEACQSGGVVTIDQNGDKKITLSSVWLHNHAQQQLKIALGSRSDAENGTWIMDLYFLQYAAYAFMPGVGDQFTCKIDWTTNYENLITRFSAWKLSRRNESTGLDMYIGKFNPDDTHDSQIWTNDNNRPYRLQDNMNHATLQYKYENMQDTTPEFDEDVTVIIRNTCDSAKIRDTVDRRIVQFMDMYKNK